MGRSLRLASAPNAGRILLLTRRQVKGFFRFFSYKINSFIFSPYRRCQVMTPTQIAILILAGVILLATAAYIAQQIENQRQARRLRLMALKDGIRRVTYLLESIPGPFQTPEIRQVLGTVLKQRWGQLQQLERKAEHQAECDTQQQRLAEPVVSLSFEPDALTLVPDRETGRRIRAQLRDLAQYLKQLHDNGELSAQAASLVMRQVKSGFHRVSCDLSILDARDLESSRGPQVAVHQYRSCLSKLRAIKGQPTERQLRNLQTYLARVEQRLAPTDDT